MGLGVGVHIFYSLVGVGLIISQSIVLFNVIKYLGASYLIHIGIKALKSKPSSKLEHEIDENNKNISNLKDLGIGFLTNVLNPKATLFFLSLFTQVINPEIPVFIQAIYGAEMMTVTAIWFSVLAIFFSHKIFRDKIIKVKHHIERVLGVALVTLSIKVATISVKE
jgi:threonine/homoserine/homoserine lactone efflux protein